MSIVTNERQAAPSWRLSSSPSVNSVRRSSETFKLVRSLLMIAVPALLLLITGVVAGVSPDAGRVDRGVSAGGVTIGGSSRAQAAHTLTARFDAFLNKPLAFTLDGESVAVSPRDLGMTFDVNETLDLAMNVGRGGIFNAAAERFTAHTFGVEISPVFTYDSQKLVQVLRGLGGDEMVAPTNAMFVVNGDQLDIRGSASGTGIDANDAVRQLQSVVAGLTDKPLTVKVITVNPTISTSALQSVGNVAAAVLQEPVTLTDGQHYWEMTSPALAKVLTAKNGKLGIDTAAIAPIIDSLSSTVNREPRDASIEVRTDGIFYVEPEVKSRTLDVTASAQQIEQSLVTGEHQVSLVTTEETPSTTAASLQPLLDKANAIVNQGMSVSWADGEQAINKAALASTIIFDEQDGTLKIDHDTMFHVLEPIARSINRPASGYRWKDGEVIAPAGALPGRAVDISSSVDVITQNALGGQGSAALVVDNQEDPVSGANAIVIRDRLSSASTYYGSSSYNRATNVELATASLDGALIQPGGTFSFNNAIGGTATLDDGYQVGFGIVAGDDGQPHTVPSVAGGICQVATTTFQAAFWSGMPIGTRNWHLYWIPNYGSGPGGMTGLDATVDPDYGLDFTFHNPTDEWLAIRAVADGEWVTVEIWGTDQGWHVQGDDPVISNVVKADTTMVYQPNDQLAQGEQVYVEHAEDGFTANIHRVVTDGDSVVIEDTTFSSYYQPSRNVTLVGPGTQVATDNSSDTSASDEVTDSSSDTSDTADDATTTTDTPVETPAETDTAPTMTPEPTPTSTPDSTTDAPTETVDATAGLE